MVGIKNFQMQETCYYCPFCDYEFGRCMADIEERYTEGYGIIPPEKSNLFNCASMRLYMREYGHGPGKPDWCPLVEIEIKDTEAKE